MSCAINTSAGSCTQSALRTLASRSIAATAALRTQQRRSLNTLSPQHLQQHTCSPQCNRLSSITSHSRMRTSQQRVQHPQPHRHFAANPSGNAKKSVQARGEEVRHPCFGFQQADMLTLQDLKKWQEAEPLDQPKPSAAKRVSQMPTLYTLRTPRTHTQEDVNKYFCLGAGTEHFKRFPRPLMWQLKHEYKVTGNFYLLRQHDFDLRQRLLDIEQQKFAQGLRTQEELSELPPVPFALHSPNGFGKSAALSYIGQYVRGTAQEAQEDAKFTALEQTRKPWVLLYVLADANLLHKGGAIEPNREPGKTHLWDQPVYAAYFLEHIAKMDARALKQATIKLTHHAYDWSECGEAPGLTQGETLYDLALLGSTSPRQATRVLYHLIDECRIAHEFHTLVLIDNVNRWEGKSNFIDGEHANFRSLPAKRLSFVDAFQTFLYESPRSGLTVLSSCDHASQRRLLSTYADGRAEVIQVPRYTLSQVKNALVHYHMSRHMRFEVRPKVLAQIWNSTQGAPKLVEAAADYGPIDDDDEHENDEQIDTQ